MHPYIVIDTKDKCITPHIMEISYSSNNIYYIKFLSPFLIHIVWYLHSVLAGYIFDIVSKVKRQVTH